MSTRKIDRTSLKDHWECPTCKNRDGRPKRSYPSKSVAKRIRRNHHGEKHFSVYRCPHFATWHLGHLPGAVRRGQASRVEACRRG